MSSSGWLSLWSSAPTCNGVRRNGGGGSSSNGAVAAAAAVFGLQGRGHCNNVNADDDDAADDDDDDDDDYYIR
ncbi:hypothetical protein PV325_004860 [Microctonus aethiopoides]|nr:hypothetical protein PV325_004860 [Microctonus aethiopoides]